MNRIVVLVCGVSSILSVVACDQLKTQESAQVQVSPNASGVNVTPTGVAMPGVNVTSTGVTTTGANVNQGAGANANAAPNGARPAAPTATSTATPAKPISKGECAMGYCECRGGKCAQTCNAGETCHFTCAGGGCTQTCNAGAASCNLDCLGGNCVQKCVGACNKTCAGGGCS
jgi:hypothetical protein